MTAVADKKWIIETTEAGAYTHLIGRDNHLTNLVDIIEAIDRGECPTTPEQAYWLSQDDRPERPRLTPTESQVLRLIGDGNKQESVGRRLGIARSTVATHLTNIRDKYADSGLPYVGPADYRDWAKQQELDRDRNDPTKRIDPGA